MADQEDGGIGWKGFRVDRSTQHTVVIAAFLANYFCLAGVLSTLVTRAPSGRLVANAAPVWETNEIVYTVLVFVISIVGYVFARYAETGTRWGARVLVSGVPLFVTVLFLIRAFAG